MKQSVGTVITSLFFILGILFSCSNSKVASLEKEVDLTVEQLNPVFRKFFSVAGNLVTKIKEVYTSSDRNSISISGMDAAEGGKYSLYHGKMYAPLFDYTADEATVFFTGPTELTPDIKKEMKMLEGLKSYIKDAAKKSKYIGRIGFTAVTSTGITYPGMDIAAFFQTGLDFRMVPFFSFALQEAKNRILWSTPEIAMAARGGLQSIQSGLFIDNKSIGVATIDIPLDLIAKDFLGKSYHLLLLVYKDSTVYGGSPGVDDALGMTLLGIDFDYPTEYTEYAQLPGELKLSNKARGKGVNALATLLFEGKTKGKVTIKGIKYNVYIKALEDVDYFIIGLI